MSGNDTRQKNPASFAELLALLESSLAADVLKKLRRRTSEKKLMELHFGLGLYIRNTYVYQNPNVQKLYADCRRVAGKLGLRYYFDDPDELSEMMTTALWRHLRKPARKGAKSGGTASARRATCRPKARAMTPDRTGADAVPPAGS